MAILELSGNYGVGLRSPADQTGARRHAPRLQSGLLAATPQLTSDRFHLIMRGFEKELPVPPSWSALQHQRQQFINKWRPLFTHMISLCDLRDVDMWATTQPDRLCVDNSKTLTSDVTQWGAAVKSPVLCGWWCWRGWWALVLGEGWSRSQR